MMLISFNMLPTATHINYYFVCRKKLWYFSHGLQCEHESELVHHGRNLHENSYKDKQKELMFGSIKLDWLDMKNKVVHEVKTSNKMEEAHIWQLKYYLFYLEEIGAGEFTGEINYPKMKKKKPVTLQKGDREQIRNIIEDMECINALENPPEIGKTGKKCKSCSYMEMCMI